MVPQLTRQHLPEVIPDKEIEDGVDDTVQEGQGPRHDVQGVDDGLGAFGLLPVPQP